MERRPDTHRKSIGYLLWIFGFTGSHRFYYGRPVTGTIWLLTLGPAGAADDEYDPAMTGCSMVYNLKGFSFVIKSQRGEGTITCDNGQSAKVTLKATSIGFTIGKGEIVGGKATFSPVRDIADTFGSYAALEASAGASQSAGGSVLTKGEVSLALGGTGLGVDIGATIGGFTITPKVDSD